MPPKEKSNSKAKISKNKNKESRKRKIRKPMTILIVAIRRILNRVKMKIT